MIPTVLFAAVLTFGATEGEVASCLAQTANVVEACRADIVSMQALADAAAERLAEGGSLWAAGHPAWVSELSGRAGGMMLIKSLGDNLPNADDVVLFARVPGVELSQGVVDSGAYVVGFGDNPSGYEIPWVASHATENGISESLGNVIPGWIFTAELVSALTRLGKMPVMFETIGLPGGFPRIYKYQREGIYWHDPNAVQPIEPGVLGNRYADGVVAILRRADRENAEKLEMAGAWVADAIRNSHKVFIYSMGHFLPDEIGNSAIGEAFISGVWNSGFTYIDTPVDQYGDGDVLIHIGYQHPPRGLLQAGRAAGAKVVYLDILRDRDYVDDSGVLWIDPMWTWADACVNVEGYDIPILPPSGIVNSAIAWEIYGQTQRQLGR